LDDREYLRSGQSSSQYYSASSNYYNSNASSEGQYNWNNPRKKYLNNYKFVKKKKVKGAATLNTNSESDYKADKSDHNLDINSDTDNETIPHSIDNKKELRAEFRRFYLGTNNDIKELI
jgi:hypothetical protein